MSLSFANIFSRLSSTNEPVPIVGMIESENPLIAKIKQLETLNSTFEQVEPLKLNSLNSIISRISKHLESTTLKILSTQMVIIKTVQGFQEPVDIEEILKSVKETLDKIQKGQSELPLQLRLESLKDEFPLLHEKLLSRKD